VDPADLKRLQTLYRSVVGEHAKNTCSIAESSWDISDNPEADEKHYYPAFDESTPNAGVPSSTLYDASGTPIGAVAIRDVQGNSAGTVYDSAGIARGTLYPSKKAPPIPHYRDTNVFNLLNHGTWICIDPVGAVPAGLKKKQGTFSNHEIFVDEAVFSEFRLFIHAATPVTHGSSAGAPVVHGSPAPLLFIPQF
jgi:hypothetical protein